MTKPTARQKIIAMLENKAMTISALAEATGCCHQTISKIIKSERHNLHIQSWKRSKRGPMAPRFRLGQGDDAKMPQKLTAAQKCKRWRNTEEGRQRSSEYGRGYESAASARKKIEQSGVRAIDPLLAAIMGVR